MRLRLLLLGLAAVVVLAAIPPPATTPYSRGLLRTTNATEAAAYIGASGGGGTGDVTNSYNTTYITNLYYVSGKGNTLIITNSIKLGDYYLYPVLAGSGITLVTNANPTSGTNITISASGSGGGVTNQPFNLISFSSSTNLAALDCSLGDAVEAFYKVTLTNDAYFGAPTSVSTNAKTYSIWFQQDSTGGRDVTYTNAFFKFAGGSISKPDTNANAISLIQFITSPFTNGVLYGVPALPAFQ